MGNDNMAAKKSEIAKAVNLVEVALKNKPLSTEQTTAEVLTSIRQLEPEQQNEVVKAILKEIAIDRYNSLRQYQEAADRADKNRNVFMYNAIDLEKVLAESMERKG